MQYCRAPGCPVSVVRGYCATHERDRQRGRGSQRARGYTRRWERRAALFRSRYPLCGMRPGGQAPVMSACHDQGRVTVATLVDHVVPHRGDVTLFWDEAGNWQSLCAACHVRKTTAGL
jgi:5-methylcytosine-specific restriction protein A